MEYLDPDPHFDPETKFFFCIIDENKHKFVEK